MMRILIVEDDATSRIVLGMLLRDAGHEVTEAADGAAGAGLAAGRAFDLIFMDIQMPGVDGLEATRRIRAAERATPRRTPIVALTALAREADGVACLAAGADRYLRKPVTRRDLLEVIRELSGAPAPAAAPPGALSGMGVGPAVSRLMECTGVGIDGAGELIRTALEHLPKTFDVARSAYHRQDVDSLQGAAHRLGGASGLLDLRIQQAAMNLEAAAQSANWPVVTELMTTLEHSLAQLQVELSQFLLTPRDDA